MASIVLATVGKAVGTSIGGPIGGHIGGAIGMQLGAGFGSRGSRREYEGARLEQLAVQSSAYGRMIPIVFGSMRLGGTVIWARPLKEVQTTTTTSQGGKGGGRKQASTSTTITYSYYATLAIAICEGEITRINRVWADAKLLDLSRGTYRIHTGSESQLPDPLIESFQGVGSTPAYRGMAYVVIEDFPIGDFGNRIPNFTFEVTRQTPQRDVDSTPVEALVESIMLIPGSGEFVYDTQAQFKITGQTVGSSVVQQGYSVPLNQHNADGKANLLLALDQMQQTFPNLEWVGVVVNWFGSSMDVATCSIAPRVEFTDQVATTPDSWSVNGLTRDTALLVGHDSGKPRYGGTPDSDSIIRLCTELRSRGLKIFFYPMLLMDVAGKPWRGELTGSSANVASFFTKSDGYNAFILHYAALVAGKVDAFAIGTEMKGLTKISSSTGVYPAVGQLVSLAASVKTMLGSAVKVTYAADWSEYHHTDGGWYNLDPLWASTNIDFVGIDAYFPLTNEVQEGYDQQAIRDGWTSGEGWDFYYTDPARTTTAALAPAYAWKNIDWWWNNPHVNPDSASTAWVPGSKPIWFTEYGFASVDGCSNEPNVFIDASSSGSAYPRLSRGRVDFMAQRTAIAATEAQWSGSSMVPRRFLWTWDARPYPYWPDLRSVWADGANWSTGHWVQGKLGGSHVAAAVEQIAARVGLSDAQIDSSALQMMLDGFVIHERTTARAALAQLMQAFFFTFIEQEGTLVAALLDSGASVSVDTNALVPMQANGRGMTYELERQEDIALPAVLEVHYLNRLQRYETQVQSASRTTQESRDVETLKLGLVLSENHARAIADLYLTRRWAERCRVSLQLPMRYAALQPGDMVLLNDGPEQQRLRVEQVQMGRPGIIRVRATRTESEPWDGYIAPAEGSGGEALLPAAATRCELLDIPALPGDRQDDCTLRIAACGMAAGWQGAVLLRLSSYGEDVVLADLERPATIGTCLQALGPADSCRIDRVNTLEVSLLGEATLSSASEEAVLNGANVAMVGNELIQFMHAEQLDTGLYRISGLLRGRLGTESQVSGHSAGERFVLLDAAVVPITIPATAKGSSWNLRAVSVGASLDIGTEFAQTITAQSLKPYAPVHVQARRHITGDVMLGWARRARIDGALREAVDIPLMEQREEYDVQVLVAGLPVRSWRSSSSEQLYTYAQQVADFGTPPSSITLRVAQISALCGLGEAAQATVIPQ